MHCLLSCLVLSLCCSRFKEMQTSGEMLLPGYVDVLKLQVENVGPCVGPCALGPVV